MKLLEVTLPARIVLTPDIVAQAFCAMSDEDQAQFFIECSKIAANWSEASKYGGADFQWFSVGRHLRTCACATEEALEMVRAIAWATEEHAE